ncbi:type II secretion system protein GspD [Bacteriovorax stolpii]|uniref:Type II secretion system protein GspD n=1 Tax=Bacteriovorax stolpii TaxID=960 RepID=A0A2K9NR37_BACTC|nr:type II secretion system secretin GspD [Bacteriovorax stolpii]AUN97968.1 type II secretion system protein GspD [Bacteriovorax stolpii]QDK42046.1 type II secretion system protein GspD [Bacteriovorax stolpii]TDP51801.1 type II secretion system protein D (GspD) [Bacteriovorax stolpii]
MKKNVNLSKVLTASLLLTTVGLSPEVRAQFDKFKSKTKFNRPSGAANAKKGVNTPSDISIPDTGKSASSLLEGSAQDTTNFAPGDDEGGDEMADEGTDSFEESSRGGSGSSDAFGRKRTGSASPTKTDKKYVNLNPETAFGPEVVTSFDFPNVSILDLTKHMQKLTGLNLILDKDIKGKISISSPTPITIGDAWKAYLQALSINGYSLVKSGAFYTIVNNRDIRYSPTTMYTGTYTPNTENYVMQIIPLKYVNSREVANSFRPFMSRYGRIIEIKQTNTVIVQETGTHINRLMKLIKFIDIPGHEESLQIIKVRNSSAQEIATLLDKILKNGSGAGGVPRTNTVASGSGSSSQSNISRIIAEPRTNSIIAMANSDGARELRGLIEKLDVKVVAAGSGQIHVYYLNYGDSEALAKTLSSLVGNAPRSGAAGGLTRFTSPTSGTATTATLFNSEVKITSDKENNALVVTASPTDYETVKTVIAQLDIPRDQVYVEGLMMETQVSRGQGFGISLIGAYGSGGSQKAGYGNTNDLLSLMTNNITNLSGLFVGGGIGRKVDLKTPDGNTIQVNSVNGLITAIATNAGTNVLATPQILTMDNVEGAFESGEEVPTTETTSATNGSTTNSIKMQKVSLNLKITPQINKVTRFVKLKIDQKIVDFSGRQVNSTQGGVGTVIRAFNTTVVVRDKDTIAMGGLMRDKETNTTSKVPLLGDIPVLGWLFKNTTKSVEKVNLLFFMTPKILASYEKTNAENVKDLLNRRQSHLKNMVGDDDAFSTTVKGLYDKAKKQGEGPLYDTSETEKYKDRNEAIGVDATEGNVPDYQEIIQKAENKPAGTTDPVTSVQ